MPLNISESRETGTGRFLTTYAGAGVQHIAIATDDIVQTLRQLMARGTRFLTIPANYNAMIVSSLESSSAAVAISNTEP
jgi:4-hydroxyphenylpyruvate dioxygenase